LAESKVEPVLLSCSAVVGARAASHLDF